MNEDYINSFKGLENLYGRDSLKKLHNGHVMIIGLGGVGSWCAEGLIRSGVGRLDIVDLDEVCISNTNRQLQATIKNYGKSKVEVLKDRLLEINPSAKINAICDFFSMDSAESILASKPNIVIDCIDSISNKVLIIRKCNELNISLITTGAAGGKTDPTAIETNDITKTKNDSLLYRVKKLLRQEYSYPRDGSSWNIRAVFCSQRPIYSNGEGELRVKSSIEVKKRDCNGTLGSSVFVTAAIGLTAGAQAVQLILNE